MWERKTSIIILPKDKILREKLDFKLKAHKEVFDSGAPLRSQMYIFCVIKILERLLKDGQVIVWDISKEIFEEHPYSYDTDAFLSACLFIENYCAQVNPNHPRIGYPPPIGRKVRLLNDYRVTARAPMEKVAINATGVTKSIAMIRINITIPAGTIGIVSEAHSLIAGLDYDKECVIQFDDPQIPRIVAIPFDILELAD